MIRRPVVGPRSKEWKCCFCLHVRTATICLGIWHLMLHLVALCVLVIILHSPNLINQLEHPDQSMMGVGVGSISRYNGDNSLLNKVDDNGTPLGEMEHPPYAYRDHSLTYHDVDMGALVTICTLAITLMMLYGAVKQKPAHILPFFCLQLFDFAITTLTATGYLCYLRSVHRLVSESRHLPMREELLKLSPQTLSLLVLVGFICVMLFKAYCIGVVWRCYKYLTMRQHALKTLLPYVIPDPTTTSNLDATLNPNDINATRTAMMMNCEPAYSSLLPDYEEAVKQSQDIPPSYQAAVASAGLIEKEAAASSADATEETNKPETEPAKTPEPETTTKSEPHNV